MTSTALTALSAALPRPSTVAIRRLTGCEPGAGDHADGSAPAADPARALHLRRSPIAAQARDRVHLVLRLILEVIDGRRPLGQLAGALAEPVHGYLTAMTTRAHPPRSRACPAEPAGCAALRSTRLAQPRDGVVEASAVWQFRGRVRALAARFEQHHVDGSPRWCCVHLRLG